MAKALVVTSKNKGRAAGGLQKIQLRVWTPMLDSLKSYTEDACLRRDAFLAKVLDYELSVLEGCDFRNSDEAATYVHKELRGLKNTLATFSFPESLVQRLNAVAESRNIHRDCIFNRILLLLVPRNQRAIYNWLYRDVTDDIAEDTLQEGIEQNSVTFPGLFFYSSLHAVRDRLESDQELIDPLGLIRDWIHEYQSEAIEDYFDREPLTRIIYESMKLKLPSGENPMTGFNVRFPDVLVPGTKDHEVINNFLLEL